MSLLDPNSVDMAVRFPNDENRIALVIFDTVEIADSAEREAALYQKLLTYLEYVASGQFRKSRPSLQEKDLVVEIVYAYPPTQTMKKIEAVHHPKVESLVLPVKVISFDDFCARFGIGSKDLLPAKAN